MSRKDLQHIQLDTFLDNGKQQNAISKNLKDTLFTTAENIPLKKDMLNKI